MKRPTARSDAELVGPLRGVGHAFFGRFTELSPVQRLAIPAVLGGRDVLVCSPTASGKTEAVIAPLVARMLSGPASDHAPRVLLVAPTRALVNDLAARLEQPLAVLGLTCGRQTGDHREKHSSRHLLITTPESFDSMLVRDGVRTNGVLSDHLLAHVQAVFVDEAHCFQFSNRGAQVAFLLHRLRRLRRWARDLKLSSSSDVQVCGASATVVAPDDAARQLLGPCASALVVPGSREIQIFDGVSAWRSVDAHTSAKDLAASLPLSTDPLRLAEILWSALKPADCRKILAFVNSRAACDRYALDLRGELQKHRDIWVGAHHGSLSRARREEAEDQFRTRRDAVLVATSTLEVGIDIGDVDAVCLVDSPPDVSALLQRVGRGGRRIGRTRVLPAVRGAVDACALGSMLASACAGEIDGRANVRRWSVLVQQICSALYQSGARGRQPDTLIELALGVWPDVPQTSVIALLDGLLAAGHLERRRTQLHLAGELEVLVEEAGGSVHSNIASGPPGVAVIDVLTGEVLANVQSIDDGESTVALGGESLRIVDTADGISVRSERGGRSASAARYTTRRNPVALAFATHVQRGVGFASTDAPVVDGPEQKLWFHFCGDLWERVIRLLAPDLLGGRIVAGLCAEVTRDPRPVLAALAADGRLRDRILPFAVELSSFVEPGRFRRYCPPATAAEEVLDLVDVPSLIRWLASRRCTALADGSPLVAPLLRLIPASSRSPGR